MTTNEWDIVGNSFQGPNYLVARGKSIEIKMTNNPHVRLHLTFYPQFNINQYQLRVHTGDDRKIFYFTSMAELHQSLPKKVAGMINQQPELQKGLALLLDSISSYGHTRSISKQQPHATEPEAADRWRALLEV